MKTEDIPKTASPWIPEPNEETLALIGKLGEECCELGARICRAVIQGFNEFDPGDGRSNAEHIWDEIADVEAMIAQLQERRSTPGVRTNIQVRRIRKINFKRPWFDFLRDRVS